MARWQAEATERLATAFWWRSAEDWVYAGTLRWASAVYDRNRSAGPTPRTDIASTGAGSGVWDRPSGRCGGDLPPCSVMMCESRGDIRAENPTSSASGKWQVIDSTWAGFMGYARASHAPEWVQDEKARQLYAGGAGRGHWVC